MKKNLLVILPVLATLSAGCVLAQSQTNLPAQMQPDRIKAVMAEVADWQLENLSDKHRRNGWVYGAFFAGLTAWAQMADSDKYYNALLEFGEGNDWEILVRRRNPYHADDHAVAQMYIEMYEKYGDPNMIAQTKEHFDWILANQRDTPLTHDNVKHKQRWIWSDALFMAPPVWAKLARITGEEKYFDFMDEEWWAITDYLFDEEEDLYYRDDRFFDKREANDEKVFWSRGNGWVFGGLVRVLEEMPEDHKDRAKYEDLYKKMAAKIVEIQQPSGMWHPSLLDPETFDKKEASGSAFFCYGLAWGINHGLLDRETYLPAVEKAWTGLVNCVHPDGKLGNVQPVGIDPRQITDDQTELYGVGAFLLAGSEVYKIAVLNGKEAKDFSVVNRTREFEDDKTVSLEWSGIKNSVQGLTKDNVGLFDFKTNRFLAPQIVEDGKKSELTFQADFAPGEKKYFRVMKKPPEKT